MSRARALAALAAAGLLCGSAAVSADPDAGPQTLRLEQVLRSAETSYPPLRAAEAGRRAAAGGLLAARGRYDPTLLADGDLRPLGFYESYAGSARVEQLTTLFGTRFFAGYRVGSGDFAAYAGESQTLDDGEVFGGLELPLLRGLAIDEPRAELRRAALDLERVGLEVDLRRIEVRRDAALAYWGWLAATLGVAVEERLLSVAEERQSQIRGRVERGALPPVDLDDNERLIVDRRIRLRRAQQDAEQSAIALSLFLRDADGEPVIPERERAPEGFPPEEPPDRERLGRDLELAGEEHPVLAVLDAEIARAEVARDLARNEVLPALSLRVEGSSDFGGELSGISSEGSISRNPRAETELKLLIRSELPVLQREARGKAEQLEAELRRLENRRRFARDRTAAEIRQAMAGLEAAFAESVAAQRTLELARRLERAEERRRVLGTSNLINVNIRELQTAEADRALIQAQNRYFRARALYEAALGGVAPAS